MRSRTRKAFTIFELTVASALGLLMGAVLLRLFLSSLNFQTNGLRQANLKQQMNVALQRLSADLQQSGPAGITVGPNRISIQRIADISTDIPPRQIWETSIQVYFLSNGLRHRIWPPTPPDLGVTLTPSSPFHPDPTQMTALARLQGSVLLGGNVSSINLSNPSTLPVTLSVSVSEDGRSLTSSRILSLRNAE